MLIDDPRKTKEADALLQYDLGREKTAYFPGNSVKDAISKTPFTGLNIGNVIATKPSLTVELAHDIRKGSRLRIMGNDGLDAQAQKIRKILVNGEITEKAEAGDQIELPEMKGDFHKDEQVFMVGTSSMRFPTQIDKMESNSVSHFPQKKKQAAIRELAISKPPAKEEIFIRINSSAWLRKLFLNRIDRLIISLPHDELGKLDLKSNFWQKNIGKVIIQLPRFISEKNIPAWQKEIMRLIKQSVTSFMLSHLSQKLLFDGSHALRLYTSENVYVLNDAAAAFLQNEHISNWVYPLENDFPNLISGKDHRGIVPLLYYPELFYSRMPVALSENSLFSDQRQNFRKQVRDGITIILPEHPVSLLQFHKRLIDKGFRRFLIDFSWYNPSSNTFNRVYKNFQNSFQLKLVYVFLQKFRYFLRYFLILFFLYNSTLFF
jgi:putative protease